MAAKNSHRFLTHDTDALTYQQNGRPTSTPRPTHPRNLHPQPCTAQCALRSTQTTKHNYFKVCSYKSVTKCLKFSTQCNHVILPLQNDGTVFITWSLLQPAAGHQGCLPGKSSKEMRANALLVSSTHDSHQGEEANLFSMF